MSSFVLSRDLDVSGNTNFTGSTTVTTPFVSTYRRRAITTNLTLNGASTEDLIAVTNTATQRTITLPEINTLNYTNKYKAFTIVDESGGAGTNQITITAGGSDQILGNSTSNITSDWGSIRLYSVPNAPDLAANVGRWFIAAVVPS